MSDANSKFTNFKVHTQYSICEGAIKIEDLAEYCKKNKIKALGLSDSFNLCGALEFSEEISKAGTQPIIGSQINFEFNNITTFSNPYFISVTLKSKEDLFDGVDLTNDTEVIEQLVSFFNFRYGKFI